MKLEVLSSKLKKPTILIVDDDEDNRVLISQQLIELFDCSLLTAADGNTALSMASCYHLDLILLDIMLPDLAGTEVVQRLRQNPAQVKTPIIAVTALARQEDREQILQAGCDDCLTKPYDLDELDTIVHRYLKELVSG